MTNLRLIATAAVSLAVGGAIGYKVAEKRLTVEFEARLEKETASLRRMYKPDFESPQDMVEKLHGAAVTAMKEYTGEREHVAYDKIRPSQVQVVKDEAEEKPARTIFEAADDRGEIYPITLAEHTADEAGYEHVTWTYYAQDGVVTDDAEDVIEDHTKFLGEDFVEAFGRDDAGDDNVVYIRNEVVMIDYEIVRSPGSYVKEVLGEEYEPPVERPSQRINRGG